MSLITITLISAVALLHFYIMILEMFYWNTSKVRKIFHTTAEFAQSTQVLAANQGLYNGFLAIGLSISLIIHLLNLENVFLVKFIATIFLCFVISAGFYGSITSSKKIFYIQALPAIIALFCLYLF